MLQNNNAMPYLSTPLISAASEKCSYIDPPHDKHLRLNCKNSSQKVEIYGR